MINPAFIVDGHMEQLIIQKACPGKPVRRLECNGKDVSFEAAGKRAASLIRLLKKYHPIIIIFDRECRNETSEEIASKLKNAIIKSGIDQIELIIGIPDRMIENWLLADVQAISKHYSITINNITQSYEGKHGKNEIKKIIGNYSYRETEDGFEIFELLNMNLVYDNSPSFKLFFDTIKKLQCQFLQKINCAQQQVPGSGGVPPSPKLPS